MQILQCDLFRKLLQLRPKFCYKNRLCYHGLVCFSASFIIIIIISVHITTFYFLFYSTCTFCSTTNNICSAVEIDPATSCITAVYSPTVPQWSTTESETTPIFTNSEHFLRLKLLSLVQYKRC